MRGSALEMGETDGRRDGQTDDKRTVGAHGLKNRKLSSKEKMKIQALVGFKATNSL